MGNFMNNLKYKFIRFMQGRNGPDQLYMALLVAYVVILFVNIFLDTWVLSLVMWAVLVLAMFRVFSKNVYRRRAENQKYLALRGKIGGFFKLTGNRIRDFRTFRYHKCPHCKAMLRLPRRRGKHTARCPRCGGSFEVTVRI